MTHFAVFALALAGFALLFVAMARHRQDWLIAERTFATAATLRFAGAALIALGFVVAGGVLGWGYGAVCWFGWLTLAAGLVVAINSNRTRLLRWTRRGRP